jgi:hypothetical protein
MERMGDDDEDDTLEPTSPKLPVRAESPKGGTAEEKFAFRVQALDSLVFQSQCWTEVSYNSVKTKTHNLLSSVQAEGTTRLHNLEEVERAKRTVRARADKLLRQARTADIDMQVRCTAKLDEIAAEVTAGVEENAASLKRGEKQARAISDEICSIHGELEQLRKFREGKYTGLFEGVNVKLKEIREAANAERRLREESEMTMLEVFGQMGQQMQLCFETCRRDRVDGTNRIIDVMEKVLPAMDQAITQGENIMDANMTGDGVVSANASDMAQVTTEALQKKRKGRGTLKGQKSLAFKGTVM